MPKFIHRSLPKPLQQLDLKILKKVVEINFFVDIIDLQVVNFI